MAFLRAFPLRPSLSQTTEPDCDEIMFHAILTLILLSEPHPKSWLGVSLVKEGPCLRVAGMAIHGPYSKAGGQLNQCIARIAEQKVAGPEDASALVSAQPDGQIVEIELSTTQRLRARVEPQPPDAMEQICTGTTEQQVLISIISDEASKPRRAVYRAPATLGDVVKNEHLTSSVKVLLRTCTDQVGKLIEHPTTDLQLYFGSTLLVTTTSDAQPILSPPKKNKSVSPPKKNKSGSDEEDVL